MPRRRPSTLELIGWWALFMAGTITIIWYLW